MEHWAYCLLIPVPPQPVGEAELEATKRRFLHHSVVPLLAARRWFFRRFAIERERLGWLCQYSLAVYVELLRGDNLGCLRAALQHELTKKGVHAVIEVREWDGCFGKDYGGPAAQAAMRDFVCEAAPVAIIEQRDPFDIALRHTARGRAPLDGIKHWWMWLREGELVDGATLDALWAAMLEKQDPAR